MKLKVHVEGATVKAPKFSRLEGSAVSSVIPPPAEHDAYQC